MTEEPIREGEWVEGSEGDERKKPLERVKNEMQNIRERFARGGFFAFAIFFAVGIVFGISAKTIAARSITLGYWDYMVSPKEISAVNLNEIQQRLLGKQAEQAKEQEEAMKKAQEEAEAKLPPLPPAPEPPELPQEEK